MLLDLHSLSEHTDAVLGRYFGFISLLTLLVLDEISFFALIVTLGNKMGSLPGFLKDIVNIAILDCFILYKNIVVNKYFISAFVFSVFLLQMLILSTCANSNLARNHSALWARQAKVGILISVRTLWSYFLKISFFSVVQRVSKLSVVGSRIIIVSCYLLFF